MRGVFITGTDTGVGKTRIAVGLLWAASAAGLRAVGMKPVAAGIAPGGSVNADVRALASGGNLDAPLADRMRPESLSEFAGQEHILAPGKPLADLAHGHL